MIAEEFMKADEVIVHSLRCWVGEDGMKLDEASARRVAVLEQSGYVVDLESRRASSRHGCVMCQVERRGGGGDVAAIENVE